MFRLTSAFLIAGLVFALAASVPAGADTIENQLSRLRAGQHNAISKAIWKKSGKRRYRNARPAIVAAVRRHAARAGVPVRVALAIVRQESGFNPRARGRAGEIGLMQLKCTTARGMGYRGSCAGLYAVNTNLTYGMRYLKKALRRGSVGYYNAGVGAKRLPAGARKYARQVSRKI